MSLGLSCDKSTLVQVIAWYHQATRHYLSQCWPRSLSRYDVTNPQWINVPQYKNISTWLNLSQCYFQEIRFLGRQHILIKTLEFRACFIWHVWVMIVWYRIGSLWNLCLFPPCKCAYLFNRACYPCSHNLSDTEPNLVAKILATKFGDRLCMGYQKPMHKQSPILVGKILATKFNFVTHW